ncbi:MAG: PTS sugar transporter subunit IIA [Kiritimatiellae bacterium]|nr:PTS sugar transporter subunit IIA [Kiritimatiellia bacterium]
MNLKKIITEKTVTLDIRGETKQEIIRELLEVAGAAGFVSDLDGAFDALMERENKMSTAMQNGIAMPHAKTDAVTKLIGVIGLKKDGVDFHSIDGQPTRIFVMTLSPLNRAGPHIQFLAEIGRLLSQEGTTDRILAAASPSDVCELLGG